MHAMLRWLKQLPLALWVFLAVGYLIAVGFRLNDLAGVYQSIEELADQPASAGLKDEYERIRSRTQKRLVEAVILTSASIALACWKAGMKPQFTTSTMLLATAFVAIWLSGAIAYQRLCMPLFNLMDICVGLMGWMPLWLPLVFMAYSIGQRTLTWRIVLVFAVAELASFGVTYVADKLPLFS